MNNEKVKEISAYHEYEEYIPVTGELKEVVEWKSDFPGGIGNFGLSILSTLQKYQYLNKKNLERSLLIRNRNSWKKNMLSKTLKMLRKGGFISAFGTRNHSMPKDYYCLVLYSITEKGIKELQKRNSEFKDRNMTEKIDLERDGISEVLKIASLNQWHIALHYSYSRRIISSRYYSFCIENEKCVPSVIECRMEAKDKKRFQTKARNVTLFAYPAPRVEEHVETFVRDLLKLQNELVKNPRKFRPALIVAVCENLAHGAWLSWQINKYRQTRPFYVLYSMDMITAGDSPLSHLYVCDADEEGILHANVNLIR